MERDNVLWIDNSIEQARIVGYIYLLCEVACIRQRKLNRFLIISLMLSNVNVSKRICITSEANASELLEDR